MKLILAIVSDDDTKNLIKELNNNRFQATKLATTGGFLSMGNTTLIIGTEDNLVDQAISIIKDNCEKRTEIMPQISGLSRFASTPIEVNVGGATIFVLDVEQFIKA